MSSYLQNSPEPPKWWVWFTYGALATLVLVVVFTRSCGNPQPTQTVETVTIHRTDTIIIRDTVRQTKYVPYNVVIDNSKVMECDTNYYNTTFKDSNYQITVYGGKVDSLTTEIYQKELHIIDSIKTTTTITNTNYIYPNNLYLSVNLNYGMDKSFAPELMLSGNIRKIILHLGVGYDLSKQAKGFYGKIGIGIRINKTK